MFQQFLFIGQTLFLEEYIDKDKSWNFGLFSTDMSSVVCPWSGNDLTIN